MSSGTRSTRRTVLLTAPLAIAPALTGCSLDLDPTPEDPTLTPGLDGGSAGPDDTDGPDGTEGTEDTEDTDGGDAAEADVALVARVRQTLSAAYGEVRVTVTAQPRLRPSIEPFARLHRAHAGELGGLRSPQSGIDRVGRRETPRAARRRVVRLETSVEDVLVEASVAAASGPLAATFASMAGAVAQARVAL